MNKVLPGLLSHDYYLVLKAGRITESMKATKIKMKSGCGNSYQLTEIDEIYITGCDNEGFFKKAVLHDYLVDHPGTIQVDISPYPNCLPEKSTLGEKYVKSAPNASSSDNLLKLPRV